MISRTGLGKRLMDMITNTAEKIDSVQKTMLTCFVSNKGALGFYNRLGFETDEYSPGERKLRGGKVMVPDYVILSRKTGRGRDKPGPRYVSGLEPNGKC